MKKLALVLATVAIVLLLFFRNAEEQPLSAIESEAAKESRATTELTAPRSDRDQVRELDFAESVSDPVSELESNDASAPEISPEKRFHGRVVTAEDGRPIADCGIYLRRPAKHDRAFGLGGVHSEVFELRDVPPDASTDARGEFDLAFADADTRSILSIAIEGRTPALVNLTAQYGDPNNRLVVRLSRSARIDGRIEDLRGDAGMLRVVLMTEAYNFGQPDNTFVSGADPTWSVEASPLGDFAFEWLPSRVPLRVEIRSSGETLLELPTPIVLEPGETRAVEWSVGGGATLQGIALDTRERPTTDVPIWLTSAAKSYGLYLESYREPVMRARSDSAGQFTFEDIAPGDWLVGPAPPANRQSGPDAIAPAATRVTVLPGDRTVEVTVRVHRGQFISGRVLDPVGAPARSAHVQAVLVDGAGIQYSSTERDGSFRIGPLVAGSYSLTAGGLGNKSDARSEPVEAATGDDDIVLKLLPGARVSGRIVDGGTGEPVAGLVTILPTEGIGGRLGFGTPKDTFDFDGLEPDSYHITAALSDGRVGERRDLRLEPGQHVEDLEIRVHAGGHVRLFYDGPAEYASYTIARDGVPYALNSLHRGTDETHSVPSGELVVKLWAYDRSVDVSPPPILFEREQEIDITIGEEIEVVFDVEE